MKQFLVIGGHAGTDNGVSELHDFCAGVQTALADAGRVHATTVDALQFVIAPGTFVVIDSKTGRELRQFDHIILRNRMRTYSAIAYAVSRYCIAHNVPFFNDYSHYFPGTKLAQAVVFFEQQVRFPKTVYAMDHAQLQQAITQQLEYPCILKDARGAKGTSNYLARDAAHVQELLAAEPDVEFLAQEYCPNVCDYRVLLAGDEQLVIKRTGSAGTHLNNTSTGAAAQLAPHDIPADILQQARQVAAAMHLTIVGVDVMPHADTQAFYFLETNSQPQLFSGGLPDEKTALARKFFQKLAGE
jgi:glutathione synthase/RimK-type ligase-like ATP-grasp enzyme